MNPDIPSFPPDPGCAAPVAAYPGPPRTAADLFGRIVTARDLDSRPVAPPSWLWHGYLGPGKVTLLTSQWKSGKTTLVSLLLARLQLGGQLLGLPVAAGKAFVISEESEADWRPRFGRLGIRDHVDLLCRPFTTLPDMGQWLALVETAAAVHDRRGSTLVVIDSLQQFLPAHSENSAGALLACLTSLQRLTAAGMAVLLVHHPHKGKTVAGQAARGSGALPGFADIVIEKGYYARPDDGDRRRRLVAFSRHSETPRHLLVELQEDGCDYAVLQTGPEEAAGGESWQAVLAALGSAHHKLTRQDILDGWTEGCDKPDATTLWRWLNRAVTQGQLRRDGTGRPHDPFRYWLPERGDLMRPDGGTREEMLAWNDRCMAEVFSGPQWSGGSETPAEAPASRTDPAAPAAPVPAPSEPTLPQEPEPPPGRATETGAAAAPLPDSLPPQKAAPPGSMPPEVPAHLRWPWNMANPADVPEEEWRRARADQQSG